jgi:sulfur dioxygenase
MPDLIFHQLFEHETGTYTYLLGDSRSKEAVLIDPVLEMVDRDLKLVDELGLSVVLVLDTHIHADHVTGAAEIRKRTGAKTGISASARVDAADLALVDGQRVPFGSFEIEVLATPGHTDSCLSFHCEGMVFTGDALLIRGTGRTDFQQGSSEKLYDSVHAKLFSLPGATKVFPGHDYRGFTSSSIEMEKKCNPRLGGGKTKAEFRRTMSELRLDQPRRIHEAVPANLAGGIQVESLNRNPPRPKP